MHHVSTLFTGLAAIASLAAAAPANVQVRRPASAGSSPVVVNAAPASSPSPAPMSTGTASSSSSGKGAGGLTDLDILNFALTAEHLESNFYKMGFAKFSMSDFMAQGLNEGQVKNLMSVGKTEAIHVTTLSAAISGAGGKPVEPCQYNFDSALSSAGAMIKTARVLEAVGICAYLGAAPLINSSDVLSAAGSIVTVEARHQAFIRVASGAEPVPAAFDSALSVRAVFTLAAQFINSCPQGSNLNVMPFPSISLQNPEQATVGQNLKLADPSQPAGAQYCAFVAPGGNQFSKIDNGNCVVPQNLQGEVFMMITKSKSVADSEVLAGPSVIQPS